MKRTSARTFVVIATLIALPAGCMFSGSIGGLFSGSITLLIGAAQADFDLSTPFADVGSLEVSWQNGTVRVRVDESATDITATGTKFVLAATDAEAQARLADLQITLDVSDSAPAQATLRYAVVNGSDAEFRADVEVVLPAGIDLTVDNVIGNVTVEGNTQPTDVAVTSGTITISDQSGHATADATNGGIMIDSFGGDVQGESRNGSVDITARPGPNDSIVGRTTNGQVTILVPADTAAALSLDAVLGLVEFSLGEFTVTDLVTGLNHVSATLNGGGGQITGETVAGVVTFGSL